MSISLSEDVVHQISSSMCNSVNNSVDGVQKEFLKNFKNISKRLFTNWPYNFTFYFVK